VRRRDINLIPTLVVGTNGEAERTIRELTERRELGYRVMGVVESAKPAPFAVARAVAGGFRSPLSIPRVTADESKLKSKVLGDLDDLPYLIRELEIQEVIITDNTLQSDRLFDVMMQLGRKQKVEFRFAPSLIDVLPQKTSVEQIGVLPMVGLFREPLSEADRFLKRTSDIAMSLAAIVLLSPVWLAAALAIKFGSRGAIVFRQERVGMDGRIFLCYKFRTMDIGADEALHREAYLKNIGGIHESDDAVFGKVQDDPRITKVGRWLRRSSLDELPQLLNVLKGDMSIVGPRPPIPYEVEEYEMRHRRRLDMKPGMTGLWQVSGRSRLSFKEMVRIDLYYIENWSLWLDLKILLLTLPAVLRGDGAR
jgi:exopolysaccharide biosynthesis polyprenyl glycosylphosphotransferase